MCVVATKPAAVAGTEQGSLPWASLRSQDLMHAQVDYYECAADGFASRRSQCQERGVRGYPTWEINGKFYPGERSLDELQSLLDAARPS